MDMRKLCMTIVFAGFAFGVNAQSNQGKPPVSHDRGGMKQESNGRVEHHHPPKEAVEACKGKSDNAACGFAGRNGENLTGICGAPSSAEGDHPLACRPAVNERHGNQGKGSDRQDGYGSQGRPD